MVIRRKAQYIKRNSQGTDFLTDVKSLLDSTYRRRVYCAGERSNEGDVSQYEGDYDPGYSVSDVLPAGRE